VCAFGIMGGSLITYQLPPNLIPNLNSVFAVPDDVGHVTHVSVLT
jgi:hypothetical protein